MCAATVAAFAALLGSVEVASAGILDPVTEAPPPLVTPPSVVDAEEAVDEATAQATETVDQATETAGQVTEEVNDTVGSVGKTVDEVVNGTPVGKVLDEVERVVTPVVKDPVQQPPTAGERPPEAAASPPDSAKSDTVALPADLAVDVGAPSTLSAAGAPSLSAAEAASWPGAPGAAAVSPVRQFGEASASGAALERPLQLLPPALAMSDEAATASRADESSGLPWPFSPSFPVDTAAVAALVAGAAGAALTVALLAAFLLMAPSAGRWLRPGPTLGWPPPAAPSLERPG